MTDEEVAALLRSDAPLVVIEAPAGCGKTHQAANFSAFSATSLKAGKVLVLTHTHAACSVIAERTKTHQSRVDIRTLDSLINQIAKAYRVSLLLTETTLDWTQPNEFAEIASRVVNFLRSNPMICRHLAKNYPIIICDEHQDSSKDQEEIVLLIYKQGARVRLFGDPLQIIPGGRGSEKLCAETLKRWEELKTRAVFGELETPHRWKKHNPELGRWIYETRKALKNECAFDLNPNFPSIRIVYAENGAMGRMPYQLRPENWSLLDTRLNENCSMLLIASEALTVQGLRSSLRRRFPIWEGHTRKKLEIFLKSIAATDGIDTITKTEALIGFLKEVLSGFTEAVFCKRLREQIIALPDKPRGEVPPRLKTMAECILAEPNHIGLAKAAQHLRGFIHDGVSGFKEINIDYPRELDDFIKIGGFEDPVQGYAELSQRRSRLHPKPPRKSLSTIHKSKGLEAEHVVIFACDEAHFPQKQTRRNLLYVAISRATHRVTIVASRAKPCPLINVTK